MSHRLSLRRAEARDCWQVFAWKNLPENIAVSGSGIPARPAEHSAWFRQTLTGTRRLLWMVEPHAGMVRADRTSATQVWLSIYLVPLARGQGQSPGLIRAACDLALGHWGRGKEFWAAIHHGNTASIRCFAHAGFRQAGTPPSSVAGGRHVRYYAYLPEPERGQSRQADTAVHSVPGGAL